MRATVREVPPPNLPHLLICFGQLDLALLLSWCSVPCFVVAVFSTESVLEGLNKHREKEEKRAEDVGRDEEGECAGYEDRGEEMVSGWFEPRQDEGRVLARKEMLILAVCRASVEVLRGVPTVCALPFFVPYHERWVMQTGSPGERRRGTCGGVSQRGLYFTAVLVFE